MQTYNSRGKSEITSGLKKLSIGTKTGGSPSLISMAKMHLENPIFLSLAHLHTCASNEHIRYVERSMQTIKEIVRCGFCYMLYKNFINVITISLVQAMVTCLSMFPSQNGIPSGISPASIILGSLNPD